MLGSVVIEGFVIGLLASVVGLFLGLGVGKGLNALFVALGIDLPQAGTVFATRTVVVSLLVGTTVTVLASIVPALRATRVPAISAVREGSILPPSRFAPYAPYVALTTIALAVVSLGLGLFVSGLQTPVLLLLLGFGAIALFLGVALLASRLVKPLAAILGWPALRFGGMSGELARENSIRNPSRTASTAAALMIGLALVTVVAVLGAALRNSTEGAVRDEVAADYVGLAERLRPVPGRRRRCRRFDARSRAGLERPVRPGARGRRDRGECHRRRSTDDRGLLHVRLDPGIRRDARRARHGRGDRHRAVRRGSEPGGDRFPVATASGETVDLVVRGIYDPSELAALLGVVTVSRATFDASFPRPRNIFTFVNLSGDGGGASAGALEQTVARFPDAKLHTESGFVTSRTKDFRLILNLLYVLLAFSVVVSLFGMVNTLVLSVFERTRELGMLRAVGMTRQQARRMIRHESVITALIGAALGIPVGVFLAFIMTQALAVRRGVLAAVLPLAIFTCVAILAGVLAAILPARRASRLNVLEALQYE